MSLTRMLGPLLLLSLKALVLPPLPVNAQVVTIVGVIADSMTSRPIKGAMVYLLSGSKDLTDEQGRFRLKNVNLARDILRVRRIGYAPRANRIAERPAVAAVDLGTVLLQPLAVALDAIRIETELTAGSRKLADFYHRRAVSQGSFFTKKEIAERNPMLTSDLLRTVAGIVIICEGIGSCRPATLRRYGLEANKGYCRLQVMLDGLPTTKIPDDIPPAWIAGIEVYLGSAQGPTEFGATGNNGGSGRTVFDPHSMSQGPSELTEPFCGTVAIWTGGERE